MTDKPHVKQARKKDNPKDSEPKVQAEVIEDLDVPNEDADAVRGACITTKYVCNYSCYASAMTV